MSCFDPLYAIPYKPGHPKFGQYMVISKKKCNVVSESKDPFYIDSFTGEAFSVIRVPCGKCVGCRLDYSREWAGRIVMESFDYPDNSLFVTLTYDNDHIPVKLDDGSEDILYGVNHAHDVGPIRGATLFVKDIQDFLKRLRRTVDYNWSEHMPIRYFCAGEYGPKTHRPHYHMCLFGLPDDLLPVAKNVHGDTLFHSDLIADTWKNGNVTIGKLNFQTAAYTARYTVKKAQGQDHDYNDKLGIAREFVTMSRRPGIGRNYYDNHRDEIYKHDEIVLPSSSKDKQNVVKPPRYFDILYSADNPKDYARMKALRGEAAELVHDNLLAELKERELDEVSYLKIAEAQKLDKIKQLVRTDCID